VAEHGAAHRSGSWFRAILIALMLAILMSLLLMLVPHWILVRLPAGSRTTRVLLATAWVAVITVGLLVWGWRALPRTAGPHRSLRNGADETGPHA
jgi:hypothetical protein